MPDPLTAAAFRTLVAMALAEDLGSGDITTAATVPPSAAGEGTFIAKQPCVVAGIDVVREVFAQVDARVQCEFHVRDGDACAVGLAMGKARGAASSLLVAERTALNFFQHLCGIATATRTFVDAAGGRITVLDTRKTLPGMRTLAKYAVRCGGGTNHRAGLYDGVLIKDNHIRLAGGVGAAVARVRASGVTRPIEVEAQSLAEVDAAIEAGADIIMFDNLGDEDVKAALARVRGRAKVELSGGMTADRVRRLAPLGADFVSVGAITHSAPAADISFEIEVSGDAAHARTAAV
jgi:nicotinate-nucleotide pyrophosphorylase (carboxylating)